MKMICSVWQSWRISWGPGAWLTAWAVAAALAAPVNVRADEKRAYATHPGYVDGSALAHLADSSVGSGELVEVTLRKPMLKALAKANQRYSKGIAEFLRNLESIEAVIASGLSSTSMGGDAGAVDGEISKLIEQLDQRGWERMARVREGSRTITVYAHTANDEDFDGLTVFIRDPASGETIFANIAGKVDLGMLPIIGTKLQIPGLVLGFDAIDKERQSGQNDGAANGASNAEHAPADNGGKIARAEGAK